MTHKPTHFDRREFGVTVTWDSSRCMPVRMTMDEYRRRAAHVADLYADPDHRAFVASRTDHPEALGVRVHDEDAGMLHVYELWGMEGEREMTADDDPLTRLWTSSDGMVNVVVDSATKDLTDAVMLADVVRVWFKFKHEPVPYRFLLACA